MKKKKQVNDKKHVLHLTCQECGHKFKSERFKKYCSWGCQRLVNGRRSKQRYAEMRKIVLKARGVI